MSKAKGLEGTLLSCTLWREKKCALLFGHEETTVQPCNRATSCACSVYPAHALMPSFFLQCKTLGTTKVPSCVFWSGHFDTPLKAWHHWKFIVFEKFLQGGLPGILEGTQLILYGVSRAGKIKLVEQQELIPKNCNMSMAPFSANLHFPHHGDVSSQWPTLAIEQTDSPVCLCMQEL